jgi:hypothetical protein
MLHRGKRAVITTTVRRPYETAIPYAWVSCTDVDHTSDWPMSTCLQYWPSPEHEPEPGVAASTHWVFLSATEVWGKRAQASHSSTSLLVFTCQPRRVVQYISSDACPGRSPDVTFTGRTSGMGGSGGRICSVLFCIFYIRWRPIKASDELVGEM